METKKQAISEYFPFWVSPKRKVVSGFGLGVLASVLVFGLVLFNVSLNSPMFSGFSNFRVNSNSSVAWPFSLTGTASSVAQNPEGEVVDKTQKSNESAIAKSGIVLDLGDTHLGNFSGKASNGSHTPEKGQFVGGSNVAEIGNLKDFKSGVGMEGTHLGNSSEKVKNGSSSAEEVAIRTSHDEPVSFLGDGSDVHVNGVNSSHIGDVWSAEIKNQTILSERSNHSMVSERNDTAVSFHGSFQKCDLYDGRWVRDDDAKPYYHGGSCPYVDKDFDCHLNRRPDNGFLKWRWKPYGCDLPRLNATDFLERLRGKKLVFVGDSLNRNMWESLVCILRHSIHNKKRVFEISGRSDFKKKGFYAFRFEDYDCTVDFVSAPFLVRESSFVGRNGSVETLRLDLMDQTTSMYHDADVVVFNTGHWWTHEKTSKGEDYYQEGNRVYPRLKVLQAYRKALTTWARWVDQNIDRSRTQVIFRGYSMTHFSGGQWNSGGQCHKETEPIMNDTHLANYPSKMRALENVIQAMKTPVLYLNISRLTDYRKDGHPSIYRKIYNSTEEEIAAEQSQDCSHWCLPGVPDTWNELLYASLLQTGKGSWRT